MIDYDVADKVPKEDCEIWITRVYYDGSRWVQKVNFYADDEEIIGWDGTLAWMIAIDGDETPEPYEGEYLHLIQHVRCVEKMSEKVTYYFRVEKEAGWAEDEAGNPAECYLSWKCGVGEALDEAGEAARQRSVKELVSHTFKIAPEHLTPISEQEYRMNTEEPDEGV